jgi:hypothetical protein
MIRATMNRASEIIEYLGGITAVSRGLGHKWPTTVQGWGDRGSIPARHMPEVIAFAERIGKPITADDFLKTHGEPFPEPERRSGEAA